MNLPKIAIVGRPNVGKSSLFNALAEARLAIVRDQEGVTRDIIKTEISVFGKPALLMDTGGVVDSGDLISSLIHEKVEALLQTVDLVIFVVDGKQGFTNGDEILAKMVLKSGRPFCLLVNKIDSEWQKEQNLSEFYRFESVEVLPVSVEKREGLGALYDWLIDRMDSEDPDCESNDHEDMEREDLEAPFSVAIVGKPNVGKSSLFNCILGEDRTLVSNIAGTTVDSVFEEIDWAGLKVRFVDTAGLRRQSRVAHGDLESLSRVFTEKQLALAQLVLIVMDARIGPTDQDAKIMEMALTEHKGVILVFNKMDLAEKEEPKVRERLRSQIASTFHFFQDPIVVMTSAVTKKGLKELERVVQDTHKKLFMRISTSELNDFFVKAIRKAPAPLQGTKTVKFYYLTQTRQIPPSFIAFANYPEAVNKSYRRFLVNQIRAHWSLQGIPIRVFVMSKKKKASQ